MEIVYRGGQQSHMNSQELYVHVGRVDHLNSTLAAGISEINDSAAQTIAAWYHSPASPNSTRLSTMGQVTDDMTIGDFVSSAEYAILDDRERLVIAYLESYIISKQGRA
jgi:hypothetical protein